MATYISTARFDTTPTAAQIRGQMEAKLKGTKPQLVVVFASSTLPFAQIMGSAREAFPGATAVGSTTAGEFSEVKEGKEGVAVFVLGGDDVVVNAGMGRGLKADPEKALKAAIPNVEDDPARPHRTAILMLDPLSGNGEEAALLAGVMLGPNTRLAGGAAGDDLKFARTEVACGTDVANDAAVVVMLRSKTKLGIGVRHGHKPISKPLTVTSSHGAVVKEFDGRPAFEVWKELVGPSAKKRGVDINAIDPSQMGSHLLRYEVGLMAGADDYKIRAPLSVNADGSLNFACGIPEGAVVRVTESVEQDQVSSARTAAEQARKGLDNQQVAGALIFDCICRNLILKEKFADAVKEMQSALGGAPLAGYETYGEIAMELGQTSGFHNTTTVVLAFPGDRA